MKIVIQIEGDSTDGQHHDVSSATSYHQQINYKFIIYFKKGQCVCIERSKVLKKYVQITEFHIYIFQISLTCKNFVELEAEEEHCVANFLQKEIL